MVGNSGAMDERVEEVSRMLAGDTLMRAAKYDLAELHHHQRDESAERRE